MQELYGSDLLRRGADRGGDPAAEGCVRDGGDRHHLHLPEIQEVSMKVIVLDKPKVLSFFLRKIYGIKKIKEPQE